MAKKKSIPVAYVIASEAFAHSAKVGDLPDWLIRAVQDVAQQEVQRRERLLKQAAAGGKATKASFAQKRGQRGEIVNLAQRLRQDGQGGRNLASLIARRLNVSAGYVREILRDEGLKKNDGTP